MIARRLWFPTLLLGAVTAVLIAALWNGLPARRRLVAIVASVFCLAVAANSLVVIDRVHREVELGLDAGLRDAEGRPLSPLGPGPAAP